MQLLTPFDLAVAIGRHRDDHLSPGPPGFDIADGIVRVAQRIHPVNNRLDTAGLNQFPEELQVIAARLRKKWTQRLPGEW